MDCLSYQATIRSHHETSHLCIDCNITHSGRNKYFFVYFADTLTNLSDIIRSLIWFVSDSNTTGKVDKLHMSACLLLKFHCHFKHLFRQHRIILICHSIACKECMDTEFLGTFFLQDLECFKNLLCCHTIFGISGVVHNIVADLKHSARIITTADHLRNISYGSFYALDMCDIIKIDDPADFICIFEFFFRCIIGRKHDISLFASDCFGHHQLCHGRTVTATAILLKDLDQKWIWSCLHSKEFFEALIPCKCFFHCLCILADTFFIIKMERCRKLRSDFLKFIQGDKWYFFHNNLFSSYFLCICVYK